MAQMCGATAMKYYLPTLLKALGVEPRIALMAGAAEMTIKIGLTVGEMWAIERLGRRVCLVGGSLVMGVAMMVCWLRSAGFKLLTGSRSMVFCRSCTLGTRTRPRMWSVSSSSSSTPRATAWVWGLPRGCTAPR